MNDTTILQEGISIFKRLEQRLIYTVILLMGMKG